MSYITVGEMGVGKAQKSRNDAADVSAKAAGYTDHLEREAYATRAANAAAASGGNKLQAFNAAYARSKDENDVAEGQAQEDLSNDPAKAAFKGAVNLVKKATGGAKPGGLSMQTLGLLALGIFGLIALKKKRSKRA